MTDQRFLHIGELATECGTTTRTLRYYEDLGLIEPAMRERGNGSFRLYRVEIVERIRQIQELKDLLGWSLDDIRMHFQVEDGVKRIREAFHRSTSSMEKKQILIEARNFAERQREIIAERQKRLATMDEALRRKLVRYQELEAALNESDGQ
ncbi:MAG: MerR family transcriptional regulator [Firmicutes bacterium]|jgi:DNA-binding transcriptional MerR regulator|nr:MerR family transcriptional regulator [Bacillota bacterium]